MNNINPILELTHQMKTATAITDALFGSVKPRERNEYEMLDEAIRLANRLELLLENLAEMFADKSGNLAEAREQAGNLMLNLAVHRRDVEAGVE